MIEHNIKALSGTWRLISAIIVLILIIHTNVGLGGTTSDETILPDEASRVSLWSTIVAGGPIGFVIILASLVAVALAVENFISIRRERMVPEELSETL